MRFRQLPPAVAAGAAGIVAGIFYQKLPLKHHFLVNSAKPAIHDVEAIVSNELEKHFVDFKSVMKFGIPSYDTIRTRGNFVLSYDRRNKVPNWVMEHLTRDMIGGEAKRSGCKFFEDESLHPYFRSSPEDYIDDGRYDKGHLAAGGNYKNSKECLKDTFVMSNITPQRPGCNRKIWHSLEERVRKLVEKYGSVYVCSGPLYLPRVIQTNEEDLIKLLKDFKSNLKRLIRTDEEDLIKLLQDCEISLKREKQEKDSGQQTERKYVTYEVVGENNVAVPTHFFKVIVCEDKDNEFDMESYIIPNQTVNSNIPLKDYLVPRDTIERPAGFLIFHHLPDHTFRSINSVENAASDVSRQEKRGRGL